MERKSATALFDFEITDDLNFFFDVSYAKSVADNEIVPPWNLLFWGPDFIPADNPYIPADLQTIMADNGVPYLILSRINEDLGFITDNTETETQRFATGLQGAFGDWSWEAYYSHGKIDTTWLTSNNPIGSLYTNSVDAVRDSTGQIVCRANADGANGAPGCVPVNLFGVGSPNQEALDYFLGTAVGWVKAKQDVVAASMQGEIFDLPAGPVAVAFGLEYRKEKGSVDYDEIGQQYGYFWGGGQPVSGDFDVKEAFVEAGIPVFDTDGGTSLDVNAAVRYADYSSSGGVTPWQIGATLGFASNFTLRGTFSNDIRAPGISELYAVESRSFRNITNPDTGESKNTLIWGGGNPNLGVEDAETMTLGFIWQPGNFALAIDYYKTEISDAIGTLSAQAIVDNCYEYGIACNNVEVVNGEIVSVSTRLFNIAERTTEGIDFEATYNMDNVGGGDIVFRMLASHYMEVSFSPDRLNVVDDVGVVGSDSAGGIATPKWSGNLSADYIRNALGLNAQIVYIGGGDLLNDQTIEDINDNSVGSQVLFNLGVRYNFAIGETNLQMFGGINNVFDRDPPIAASDFISNWSSNPAVYNLIGRNYYAGVRFDF